MLDSITKPQRAHFFTECNSNTCIIIKLNKFFFSDYQSVFTLAVSKGENGALFAYIFIKQSCRSAVLEVAEAAV